MKKRVKGIELRQQNPDRSLFGINRMANEIPPDATDNSRTRLLDPPSMSGSGVTDYSVS